MGKIWAGALCVFFLTVALRAADTLPPPAKGRPDYTRDVLPILRTKCYACHGPGMQMSGFRLDRKADALRGGYSGAVILPGDSAKSKLIHLVAGYESKVVMPPAGPPLSPEQIGTLRAWIDQGAAWPDDKEPAAPVTEQKPKITHWAFQKPVRPDPPAVQARVWVRNPVDAFVLSKLESLNIAPSPEADKLTLLRRLSFDLTGLPPTPAQMEGFLRDNRADAYEHLVDSLLKSPHFGEKWARHWLDAARYADSDGYEKDTSRPHAWRWRHWVIEALNRDLPFDRFTVEQIAGDLLPNATVDQKIATGFHRNTLTNREGGTDPEEFRVEQVIDRTHTVSTVWLGLTAGCARCHDHKYDPISQKEFYEMFAFFNTAEEVNIEAPLPGEIGPYLAEKPEYDRKRNELLAEYNAPSLQSEWEKLMREGVENPGKFPDRDFSIGALRVLIDRGVDILMMDDAKRKPEQKRVLTDYFIRNYRHIISQERMDEIKFSELQEKLRELESTLPPLSMAPTLAQNPENPKTHLLVRGEWRDKGIEVRPGTLAVLPPLEDQEPTRLSLAKWLISPDNPLTSRVTVNRIWQELFGRGLVRTSEDFGTMGEKPSHPDLLDWLAVEFREQGWSMKSLIRLIVTSATYRQSSDARPELESRDPDNSLLARQSRLRLHAELVRDAALAAGGLLDTRIGGRSVRPPQPKGVAELAYNNAVKWVESTGPDRYRRGLYIHFQRTTPYPQLMNFDAPDANVTCSRRQRSNTPLQALNLLNDEVFFEAAQGLAYRVLTEASGGFREKFNYACRLALGRAPTPRELERVAKYFDGELTAYKKSDSTHPLFPHKLDGVDAAEGAAWVGVSRILLNLDEFITRE